MCMDLATAHGVSYGTMHNILHQELGLVKKSARWVPKLLSEDQKGESEDLHRLRRRHLPPLHGDDGQHRDDG
jgi:hypothetical protein